MSFLASLARRGHSQTSWLDQMCSWLGPWGHSGLHLHLRHLEHAAMSIIDYSVFNSNLNCSGATCLGLDGSLGANQGPSAVELPLFTVEMSAVGKIGCSECAGCSASGLGQILIAARPIRLGTAQKNRLL